jgi:hypothetical protein
MTESEKLTALRREIESYGGPDRYIDEEEEGLVFKKAAKAGVDQAAAEALLNQMCIEEGWTREKDIIPDLEDVLEEATRDDGVIDQKEFEHCVNYAVSMNMPRKRAMQLSVKFILDRKLAIKKGWFKKDWFADIQKQYS